MIRPTIEIATIENVAECCLLTREFIEESHWGFTYDHSVVFEQLVNFISSHDSDILIARIDGVVAGGAIIIARQDLCHETLGFIHKFYIRPEFRRTLTARFLTKACTSWFDAHNCHTSFVTDTGNIHNNPLICVFQNLMGKCGYKPTGNTLYRGKNGEISGDITSTR